MIQTNKDGRRVPRQPAALPLMAASDLFIVYHRLEGTLCLNATSREAASVSVPRT